MSTSRVTWGGWIGRVVGAVVAVSIGWVSAAGAQVHRDSRFVVKSNIGWQTTLNTRTDLVDFELYDEAGSYTTTQQIPRTVNYDLGVEGHIWKGFGLGASVSYTDISTTATIDADVPHPFFFDFHRSATVASGSLRHREWRLHLRAQYRIQIGERYRLTLSAGPSLYDARQDLVAEITAHEVGWPFDQVSVSAGRIEAVIINAVGFNAELDLTYFGLGQLGVFGSSEVLDRVGLGAMVRFNRAAPPIRLAGHFLPALELGGTQIAGGLRFVF